MSDRTIQKGSEGYDVILRIEDSTSRLPEDGVTFDSSALDLWYRREREAKVSITPVELTALTDSYASGGFLNIGDGYYRLDVPDAAFLDGADSVQIGGSVPGSIIYGSFVTLTNPLPSLFGSAAISTVASSFVKSGAEPEDGTFVNTWQLDGVVHQVYPDGGTTDVYYEFAVGGNAIPVSVSWSGFARADSDAYAVFAYNFITSSWDQIGDLDTRNSNTIRDAVFDMTRFHVGFGANLGKVRIRLYSIDGLRYGCDRLLVSYSVLAESVGYEDGAIWIDTNGSNENTETYVDGTADNPVSTWAAALTIAAELGLRKFYILNGSSIVLSGDSSNFTIEGNNWTLDLNGQTITDMAVFGAGMKGIGVGSGWEFRNCFLGEGGDLTLDPGFALLCAVAGDFIMSAAGTYYFDGCYSGVAGTATPSIDFGAGLGDQALNFRHYSGGIEVRNFGQAGTDNMSLEGGGQLVIAASCAGGTIAVRGAFTVTDNAGGAVTLSDAARYDNTDAELVRKMTQNRKEFDLTTSKMYVWNDAGDAREYQADMTDDDGDPVTAETQGPINVSRWTVI